MNKITEIEEQFIDFMAKRQQCSPDNVRADYLSLKKYFRPHSNWFRNFSEDYIRLFNFYYHIDHPTDYIYLYQQHAGVAMFRFLSYAGSKKASIADNLFYFIRLMLKGEGARAFCAFKREMVKKLKPKAEPPVRELLDRFDRLVLLDYGCGLAYNSIATARSLQQRVDRIVLVDIPSLVFDFTCYRAQLLGIKTERIDVTAENPYPELPEHHLCFANEVVEHVKDPLQLLARISAAQKSGALLYGDFEDHCPEIYHLHTDLSFFREQLKLTHRKISSDWYERI